MFIHPLTGTIVMLTHLSMQELDRELLQSDFYSQGVLLSLLVRRSGGLDAGLWLSPNPPKSGEGGCVRTPTAGFVWQKQRCWPLEMPPAAAKLLQSRGVSGSPVAGMCNMATGFGGSWFALCQTGISNGVSLLNRHRSEST